MSIVMGPILGFRSRTQGTWKTCALVVTEGEDAPRLTWSSDAGASGEATAAALKVRGRRTVWCAEMEVALGEATQTVTYELLGGTWSYGVPGTATKLRFAYTSCNGFSHPRYMKHVADRNALWKDMAERHGESPFHLILMGGDQVYADSMWETVGSLNRWLETPAKKRYKAPFTATMARQVEDFYLDLYTSRWSEPEKAKMMARIPAIMMWDDHDIFDGWGSYPAEEHECPVYQGIFGLAREYFCLFQQKARPDALPEQILPAGEGFNSVLDLGEMAVAVLDLRGERSWDQVISPASWEAVFAALQELDGGRVKHLLVMSSIPVVYLDLTFAERALALIPGSQELEDDLQDHWRALSHRIERLRLLHRLFAFAREKKCRVTLISGDVHVGALGVAESRRGDETIAINQLVSSGIVHPPPAAIVVYGFEILGGHVEEVDRGIEARLLKFAGSNQRLLGARNWLSLSVDEANRIWAEWHAEGGQEPYGKVIHPV